MGLADILGGSLLEGIKGIIGQFKLSPEKKAELDSLLEQNKQILALKQIELDEKLAEFQAREIEAASANIKAEAASGDKYTARARPSFIYVMLGIFTFNFVVFPLLARPPLDYPEALFWLFGSAMLGYTGARTWEKIGLTKMNGKK